jgi:hypothetical protein
VEASIQNDGEDDEVGSGEYQEVEVEDKAMAMA